MQKLLAGFVSGCRREVVTALVGVQQALNARTLLTIRARFVQKSGAIGFGFVFQSFNKDGLFVHEVHLTTDQTHHREVP